MSLRQAIRSKFRSDKGDPDRETMEQLSHTDTSSVTFSHLQEEDNLTLLMAQEALSASEYGSEKSCIPDTCHVMFESQLNQLQEQLVATMLENQQLSNELKLLREQMNVDQLAKQLEKEKEKSRVLMEKLQEKESKEKESPPVGSKSPRLRRLVRREKHFEKSRSLDVGNSSLPPPPPSTATATTSGSPAIHPPSSSGSVPSTSTLSPPPPPLVTTPDHDEWEDVKEEPIEEEYCLAAGAGGEGAFHLTNFTSHCPKLPLGWRQRLWEKLHHFCLELVEDFTETNTAQDEEDLNHQNANPHSDYDSKEGDPLTVRKLKENIVRFGSATKPVSNAIDNMNNLLRWKSPGSTFLAFSVYMYTMYNGWFLPLVLLLASCQLLLNYLRHRGWFSALYVCKRTELEETEKEMGVSDKFQLVLHVARKVQNQLGHIADCFEKLKNLFLWRQPEVTTHLFCVVFLSFLASLVFPASQLFTAAGLYMGIKLFLIDYVFYLFPRVRQKHDSTQRMWNSLPTDAQFEKRHTKAEIDKNLLLNQIINSGESGSQQSLTAENQSFCDLFSLPPSEKPLASWHSGRRCTLINKDKSLTSAFKNGRLYLTNSFLCFERSKTANLKNIVLPLKNIVKLEKSKPYPWMPGGGMALEVTLEKPEKTYIFGAILNRDETYHDILEAGRKAGLAWASSPTVSSPAEKLAASQMTSSSSGAAATSTTSPVIVSTMSTNSSTGTNVSSATTSSYNTTTATTTTNVALSEQTEELLKKVT